MFTPRHYHSQNADEEPKTDVADEKKETYLALHTSSLLKEELTSDRQINGHLKLK